MRVLLTGAGGFIGAQIARALVDRGAEVHAAELGVSCARRLERVLDAGGRPVAERVTLHEADLLDPAARARLLEAAEPEICVHAAWYAVPGKYLAAPENLAHLAASLELARELVDAGCRRLVGLGTCFEYDTSLGVPLSESSPTRPRFLYSASKLALHDVLGAYAPIARTSFAWCRIFYQYGPMEAPERLVPHVIDRLLGGGVAETTEGAQVRDFLHVADVGAAVAAVALSELEGAVNVGSGAPVTVRELVEAIARICGAADRVRFGAIPYRPGDPMHVLADTSKLRQTGFVPRFDLESGLRDTIDDRRSRLRLGERR